MTKLLAILALALGFTALTEAEPDRLHARYISPGAQVERYPDVSPGDPNFAELKLLVEHYGVGFALSDGKFHGELPITRGEVACFLLQSLENVDKMAASLPVTHEWPRYSLYPTSNGERPRDLKGVYPYTKAVDRLQRKYHINLKESDGLLHGDEPATQREVFACLRGRLRYNRSSDRLDAQQPVTRWDFAHALGDALDDHYMLLVEKAESRHWMP